QSFDVSDLPARVAAQVPQGDKSSGSFNADDWVPPKDQRRMDQFIVYAMAAAAQAVEDSGWQPSDEEERERTGVMIGSGIGGVPRINAGRPALSERAPRPRPALAGARSAPHLAVFYPGQPDQPCCRPCFDPLRLQGAEPRRRDRL